MKLNNKILLVTGGEGLIGKSIIKNINENEGIAISLDIKIDKTNTDPDKFHFDINKDNSIKEVLDEVINRYGKIDGLVNNAYPRTSDWGQAIENTSNESFSLNLNMQLGRIFAITKPVLELMKLNQSGSIVNIASIYGMVGNDFTIYDNTNINPPAAYAAIKGGLINFNRYIASYYGKHNIRTNCISPGGIFDNQAPIFVKNYEEKVPMKRMGKPDDIAPLVSFLLSDKSEYITGQNIAIDGGWTSV